MKRKKGIFLVLGMLFGLFLPLALPSQETLTLVYKSTNETTKHVFEYLKKIARRSGLNYKINALSSDKTYTGGSIGLILLNIAPTGLDPSIQTFLNNHKTLSHPILLTLIPRSRETSVGFLDKTKAPQGVDTITAATPWSERDNDNQTMHQTWANKIFDLLKQP